MPNNPPVQIVAEPALAEILATRRADRNAALIAAGQPPLQDESPFVSSSEVAEQQASAAARKTRLTAAAKAKIAARAEANPFFARHSRKCLICRHPDVDAIEQIYLNWFSARAIADYFRFHDLDVVYRHAAAAGLDVLRRQNVRSVLERFIEEWRHVKITSSAIIRSIRALSCVDERGHWTDLPCPPGFLIG